MLVIDPNEEPNEDYSQPNEMDAAFMHKKAPYSAHNDANLVPRDVIPEEENERTQDSAMLRITEEREETKKGSSNYDANSDASPLKGSDLNRINKQNSEKYKKQSNDDDEYEEDYEDPIETKPFQNTTEKEPTNQEDILKMINQPVDRPTTRNPRMARGASRGQKLANDKHEDMGDMHRDNEDPESLKINKEIKGNSGFQLPGDSDNDD